MSKTALEITTRSDAIASLFEVSAELLDRGVHHLSVDAAQIAIAMCKYNNSTEVKMDLKEIIAALQEPDADASEILANSDIDTDALIGNLIDADEFDLASDLVAAAAKKAEDNKADEEDSEDEDSSDEDSADEAQEKVEEKVEKAKEAKKKAAKVAYLINDMVKAGKLEVARTSMVKLQDLEAQVEEGAAALAGLIEDLVQADSIDLAREGMVELKALEDYSDLDLGPSSEVGNPEQVFTEDSFDEDIYDEDSLDDDSMSFAPMSEIETLGSIIDALMEKGDIPLAKLGMVELAEAERAASGNGQGQDVETDVLGQMKEHLAEAREIYADLQSGSDSDRMKAPKFAELVNSHLSRLAEQNGIDSWDEAVEPADPNLAEGEPVADNPVGKKAAAKKAEEAKEDEADKAEAKKAEEDEADKAEGKKAEDCKSEAESDKAEAKKAAAKKAEEAKEVEADKAEAKKAEEAKKDEADKAEAKKAEEAKEDEADKAEAKKAAAKKAEDESDEDEAKEEDDKAEAKKASSIESELVRVADLVASESPVLAQKILDCAASDEVTAQDMYALAMDMESNNFIAAAARLDEMGYFMSNWGVSGVSVARALREAKVDSINAIEVCATLWNVAPETDVSEVGLTAFAEVKGNGNALDKITEYFNSSK